MTNLAQVQAQALHDARRQLEAVRAALGAPEGADLADFATRLQAGAVSTIAALSDYAVHTERCSWDTRGDAESVCDCGLEDLLRGAPAHDAAMAELRECRDLLDAVRPVVAASVAMDANRGDGDVGPFLEAMNDHEAATAALPATVRRWAKEP